MPQSPEHIVVRAPNWIGDQVMAFPFYRALRQLHPHARIALLCREPIAGLPAPIAFRETITFTRDDGRSPRRLLALSRALAARRFDLSINLTASFSSALLFFGARIPRRVGYAERAARWLSTESLLWKGRAAGRHKAQLYLDLIPLLGGPARSVPDSIDEKTTDRRKEELIVLAPGASIRLREWPYFSQLLDALHARFPGARLAVVGADSDRRWETALDLERRESIENWIGHTSLGELVELCRTAKFVIANDSGVAHVAASLAGAPTVVLFGPGDPDYIRPLGPRVRAARASGVRCSPCEKAACAAPFGYQRCLRDLTVERVLAEVSTLMGGGPLGSTDLAGNPGVGPLRVTEP